MKLIEIVWDGPFTFKEVSQFYSHEDYGVYQIYGTHHINGTDNLLYIGQACDQTFGHRVPQREYKDYHYPEYRIYLGRLGSDTNLAIMEWNKQIDYAEQILINYGMPPYNSHRLELSHKVPSDINLLNFGKRHKLPFAITTTWRLSNYDKGLWKPFSNKPSIV